MPFTDKQDLKLIRAVKENPLLYDYNDSLYMDFNAREVVWQKIGDQLKCPALDCKARWVNIRDINRRIMRKNIQHPEQKGNLYKYSSELAFLKPYYKDCAIRNGTFSDSNDTAFDIDLPSDEKSSSPEPPKRKKRKEKTTKPQKSNAASTSALEVSTNSFGELDPSDQVDSFLLSVGATLKTFSPYHLNLAKSQIFAVVQEHDLQQIVKQSGANSEQFNSNDSIFKNTLQ